MCIFLHIFNTNNTFIYAPIIAIFIAIIKNINYNYIRTDIYLKKISFLIDSKFHE